MKEQFDGNWNNFKLGNSNKTFTYMLPMLGSKCTDLALIKDKYNLHLPQTNFVNCFIGDVEYPEIVDSILLLYEFSGRVEYLNFEEKLQNHSRYRGQYTPDYKHTMYIFEVYENRLQDYDYFKKSKYSKFNENYKKHIGMFHGLQLSSPVMQVLYKSEEMYKSWETRLSQDVSSVRIPREQEAGSTIKPHEEYYQPQYKLNKIISPLKEFEEDAD